MDQSSTGFQGVSTARGYCEGLESISVKSKPMEIIPSKPKVGGLTGGGMISYIRVRKLVKSIKQNRAEDLKGLLKSGAYVDRQVINGIANKDGEAPLHYACALGHISCVEVLLDNSAIDINVADDNMKNALSLGDSLYRR